ncbi:Glycine/D-amino acid oxidase [Amphibacillus marinus]|uniref:Glycine/D-amino acid oxidase n=1 Tax=Amphibacillus marinus TaxID=872970 RepID=A0A1H8MCR3_9BACI|nr:FAD-dependent oxidoreductase [Amphibacillus marinus]SEO15113.1 Glycine/D-amino acid oxidase [Amphibacillus marinus]
MNIQSGTYYWPTTLADCPSYPPLTKNITCDILIVGGGSTGAQMAYQLSNCDKNVVLIDKNKVGSGSTSANTALIQYAGERPFSTLSHTFGYPTMATHLQLCRQAIDELADLSQQINFDSQFERRDSLYFATVPEDLDQLETEYRILKDEGCQVSILGENEIKQRYHFSKPGAIYFHNDAQLNPFSFTHGLIHYAAEQGVSIYEQTEMNGHKFEADEVIIYTKNGYQIRAKKVIFCCGYEGVTLKNDKNITFSSTYTVTTAPIDPSEIWYNRTMIWETARPYVYIRTTADNRLIIGGLDETTIYPEYRDAKLISKRDQLIEALNKLFPSMQVEPSSFLAAQYGGTVDGLPIVGKYEQAPNCYFVFAFGDNGIVYSQALTKLIAEELIEGKSEALEIYHQARPLLNTTTKK